MEGRCRVCVISSLSLLFFVVFVIGFLVRAAAMQVLDMVG